ncbi:DNA circularization N-terminal domain-containing protein [Escherichia coli]|uniref:DNA circularization N-terminal domain-containing protein n=1 Tax=Escherichia coli TaxID=562 RepID=UPI0039895F0B
MANGTGCATPRFAAFPSSGGYRRHRWPQGYSPCLPRRETAWTDDNGAVPGQQQINAKLLGKNFQDDLNALLDALNTPAPASLSTRGSGYRPYRLARSPIASARRKTALRMSPLKCLRRASVCSRLRRITLSRKC